MPKRARKGRGEGSSTEQQASSTTTTKVDVPGQGAPSDPVVRAPGRASKNRKRRGRGEGSIFQRADGKWGCAISGGYEADGRRRRRVILGKTKDDVQQQLMKLQLKSPTSQASDVRRMTLAQYLEQWLDTDAKTRCRERTLENHQRAVRREIVPCLGRTLLTKLSAMQIQLMLSEMEDAGRSAFVRNNLRKTMNRALNRAVQLGYLAQNPCSLVGAAHLPFRPMKLLTPQDAIALLDAAKADRLYALYVVAINSGMRQGELFGLQWTDIDLEAGLLTVQRALDRKGKEGETKTGRGRRPIDLPNRAVEALRAHQEHMKQEGHGSKLVFCDTQGGPLRNPNVIRRSFRPILERAGLPRMRFHDLRHAHASLLLLMGESPKVVQERLGHAKIELTLGTYSHLLPGIQRAAADRLDALLDEARVTPVPTR